jgi:hypothetical protein
MAYAKAVLAAVLAPIVLGVAAGGVVGVLHALRILPPAERATFLAASISEAVNCVAFCLVALVPLAVVLVLVTRRWRRRSRAG